MGSLIKVLVGLLMLVSAIGLDYFGASLQSLQILIISMIIAIAGALVGIRGLIEFLGEKFGH
ncbi:hypothetical protein V6M85_02065 [Sulfolobus tengchongensis]|uniref:Uncharacterized protein n=1 Tax=Sulfolobus tengchongensis TaxID=207809 RepID=A0AAX4L1Y4_9CREN